MRTEQVTALCIARARRAACLTTRTAPRPPPTHTDFYNSEGSKTTWKRPTEAGSSSEVEAAAAAAAAAAASLAPEGGGGGSGELPLPVPAAHSAAALVLEHGGSARLVSAAVAVSRDRGAHAPA